MRAARVPVVADVVTRAELDAAVERIAALEAQMQRQRPAHARDRDLLAAIVATTPNACFTTVELVNHAAVHASLHAAMAEAGIRGARRLGKRLAQLAARPAPGYRVAQVVRSRDGWLWSVEVEP